MNFKNALIYTFSTLPDDEEIIEGVARKAFKPCGRSDLRSAGFVCPHGFEELANNFNGYTLICLNVEEKLLPAAVVRAYVDEKIREIAEGEGRNVARAERQMIRDEVIFGLIPRAFTKHRRTHAIIDHKNHLLIVDASSASKAEELISNLRDAVGSLPVMPVRVKATPRARMTLWVSEGMPQSLFVGDYCKLTSRDPGGPVFISRNEDPTGDQVSVHISSGKEVSELEVRHGEMTLVLNESLQFKRIRFSAQCLHEIQEQAEGDLVAEARGDLLLNAQAITAALFSIADAMSGKVEMEL